MRGQFIAPVLSKGGWVAVFVMAGAAHGALAQEVEIDERQVEVVDYSKVLPNGRMPAPRLVVGGQPTLAQLDEAARLGIRTVINLRTPGESEIGRADIEARGMSYVSIPIAGARGLTPENAATFNEAVDGAEKPLLVYCGSGNRVGALFALRAFFFGGVTADEAVAVGREHGLTGLAREVRRYLGLASRD